MLCFFCYFVWPTQGICHSSIYVAHVNTLLPFHGCHDWLAFFYCFLTNLHCSIVTCNFLSTSVHTYKEIYIELLMFLSPLSLHIQENVGKPIIW